MHAVASTPPTLRVAPSDRLGLTLFFAAALHAIVILGVGFAPALTRENAAPRSLEVILVHSKSEERADKPTYLAQVTQKGGGDVQEKLRPSSPFANTTAQSERGNAPQTQPLQAPPPQQARANEVLSADHAKLKAQMRPGKDQPAVPDALTAADLIPPSQEIARLSAEIRERQQNYAQMPREKYITANTQEYVFARYEEDWRLKVERVGNLNYPDEARRRNLSGNLLLDVAINADGSLKSITVKRSSGHRALDEGAIRIVKLAAPFPPLSQSIRKDYDVLHIIRTWQFQSDNRLETHN